MRARLRSSAALPRPRPLHASYCPRGRSALSRRLYSFRRGSAEVPTMAFGVHRSVCSIPIVLVSRLADHNGASRHRLGVVRVDVIDLAPQLTMDSAEVMRCGEASVAPHRRQRNCAAIKSQLRVSNRAVFATHSHGNCEPKRSAQEVDGGRRIGVVQHRHDPGHRPPPRSLTRRLFASAEIVNRNLNYLRRPLVLTAHATADAVPRLGPGGIWRPGLRPVPALAGVARGDDVPEDLLAFGGVAEPCRSG